MVHLRLTVSLFAALYFARSGVEAIYCFQCNSYHDPDCTNLQPNDTSSRFYKPCESHDEIPESEFFCRKIVQTIFDRDGIQRVVRRCGWIRHTRDCYQLTNKGHEDVVCQCFVDGCNSSVKHSGLNVIMTVLVSCSTLVLALRPS